MTRISTHSDHDHPAARASALGFVFAIVMLGSAQTLIPKDYDASVAQANNPLTGIVEDVNRQTSRFIKVPSRF